MYSSVLFIIISLLLINEIISEVTLLSFDGNTNTTSYRWTLTNDPVMGGVSYSTWVVDNDNQIGKWDGNVKIVPSLSAPGFCNLMSEKRSWPDASGHTHLLFRVRSTIPYNGFKVSFAADTLNMQFKCFKADFTLESTGEWEEIAVPFTSFSNDWSSYTGEPITTCEEDASVCPTEKNLQDITQLGFWMEGAEGEFYFELANIRAGNVTTI